MSRWFLGLLLAAFAMPAPSASPQCDGPECGGKLRALGEDSSEILEYVPEHWKVNQARAT
jgi:hypothetical protein